MGTILASVLRDELDIACFKHTLYMLGLLPAERYHVVDALRFSTVDNRTRAITGLDRHDHIDQRRWADGGSDLGDGEPTLGSREASAFDRYWPGQIAWSAGYQRPMRGPAPGINVVELWPGVPVVGVYS